jgi:hypothetical protein
MRWLTLVVENRPGTGTVIGTQDAVRAAPDGNTLLITNNALLLAPHMRGLDFDPPTSLEPICSMGSTPTVVRLRSLGHRTFPAPTRTLCALSCLNCSAGACFARRLPGRRCARISGFRCRRQASGAAWNRR